MVSLFSHRVNAKDIMRRIDATDFASCIVKKCPRGRQRRLRFAMALVSDPVLLILNEPTTGMDVEGCYSFWGAIHANTKCGCAIVFVTCYPEEADAFADWIALMCHGRIIADSTTTEVRASTGGHSPRATPIYTPGRLRDTPTDP